MSIRDVLARLGGSTKEDKEIQVLRVLDMPLESFASKRLTVQVWSNVLGDRVYFCSTEEEAQGLVGRGVSRGCVYTATELSSLLELPGIDADQVKRVHEAKVLFAGRVGEVRRQEAREEEQLQEVKVHEEDEEGHGEDYGEE